MLCISRRIVDFKEFEMGFKGFYWLYIINLTPINKYINH